jgi:F-type H+-transporting ATPase subunit a
MSKARIILLLVVCAAVLSITSFVGGSVGAAIAGTTPLDVFAVGPPHIELEPGHPFGQLPVTNTLLATWLTCIVLVVLFLFAARRPRLVPGGLQNAAEFVVEFSSNFIEQLVGKEYERRFFPLVMTVFLFIVTNAWLGLVPGFDSLEVGGVSLLRSANTDINVPLMLAVTCVLFVEYMGLQSRGLAYLRTFVDVRKIGSALRALTAGDIRDGFVGLFYGGLHLFVGLLELLGHLVRVASFSFRLFGNMTAGSVLIGAAIFMVPLVLPSVFYGLEALFGLVQAVIFASLTVVFGYGAIAYGEH